MENLFIYEGNRKGKEYYFNGKLRFEGKYVNGNRWNGKGYNANNNNFYELKEGTGNVKEYNYYDGKLVFEGEYFNGEKMEKEKNKIMKIN